jgi:osmotically-inducible protein OsmY
MICIVRTRKLQVCHITGGKTMYSLIQTKPASKIKKEETFPLDGGVVATAESRLRQSAYFELRSVACEYHEGVLTLRGRVPSYYLKQLAQALVDKVEGVLELNNQVDVR